MILKYFQLLAIMALLCCASMAQATITCSAGPTSTGVSTAYASTGVTPNVTQGIVSFTCTRSLLTDATSIILRATNGLHATGSQNRAALGASFISYEAYQDSVCSTVWSNNSTASAITVALLNVTTPQSISNSYWGCITTAGQVAPAGTYTDTVSVTVRNTTGGTTYATGTFPVSIINPATCNITTAPGNIAFIYTALGPIVNTSTNFGVTCTNQLPYTMSLDAYSGVVSGLNYSLDINSLSSPVSSKGTGLPQINTINGSMPAGQAGTCASSSCLGTQARALTITY